MSLLQNVRSLRILVAGCVLALGTSSSVRGEDDPAAAEVRKNAQQVVEAFNAAKSDDVTAKFLPKGEIIDEEGTVYQGHQEIKELLNAFFGKFPGAQLALDIESVRPVGPVAIEEGTRTMTLKDGEIKSRFRYIAVWTKTDKGWQLASFRDFADDSTPTPHEELSSLAWLIGDWVNEGTDGKVAISYRWSEDKNFLLGDFQFKSVDGAARTSTQRIGWDAAAGRIRSWLFDADGGFSEGQWTQIEDDIVIKSSSVNPDGTTATATMTITPEGKDRFTIAGTDRIVGQGREPDFEITVVRRPPTSNK